MKDRLLLAAKMSATLLLLYFLYSKMDWPEFGKIMHRANFLWVGVALAIHYVTYFWSVDRWRAILANFKIEATFSKLVRMTFIGGFFSLFLPSMIGGDFFRAYYLARDQRQRLTTTLTSTVLDRSAGFAALLAIGTVSAFLKPISIQGIPIFPCVAALTAIFLLVNMALFSSTLHRGVDGILKRRGMTSSVERLDAVVEGLKALAKNPSAVTKALLISFGIQCLVVLLVYSVSLAIRSTVPFIYFLIFVPLINVITMIPLTINGIGLREGVFYMLFSQVGMTREECISLGLLYYLVVVLTALPGGLLYSLYKKQDHLSTSLQEIEAP